MKSVTLFRLVILSFNLSLFLILQNAYGQHGDDKNEAYLQHLYDAFAMDENQKYDSAIFFYNRLINLSSTSDSMAINFIRIGDKYRVLSEFQKANEQIKKFDSLLRTETITDSSLVAIRVYLEAKILSNRGAFAEAVPYFERSIHLEIKSHGKNSSSLAKIYNFKGINYYFQGEYEQAMDSYLKAEQICDFNDLKNLDLIDILQNKAIIFAINGEFDNALLNFSQAKQILEENYRDNNIRLGTFYLNYGRLLGMVGDLKQSLSYFLQSEVLLAKSSNVDQVFMGVLFHNIGDVFQIQGDLSKAELYFSNGLKRMENVLGSLHPSVVSAKTNLGQIYYLTGNFDEAKQIFLRIMDQAIDPNTKIALMLNTGNIYKNDNQYDSASFYYNAALGYSTDILGEGHYETARILNSLGDYYLSRDSADLALPYFKYAAQIYEQNFGPMDREVGFACISMAQSHYELGNFSEADSLFDCAEEIFNPIIGQMLNDQHADDRIADVRILGYFTGRASLYRSWYAKTNNNDLLYKSLAMLQTGMDLVDKIGMGISDDSRILLNQGVRSMLADVMEVCYTLYELTGDEVYVDQAFTFSGRSKAAVLLSSVRKISALQAGGVPQYVTTEERNLNERISSLRKLIFDEQQSPQPDNNRISFLESRHFDLVRKYDSLVGFIEENYADYYTLRYDNQVVNIDQVQQQLQEDEVLLEYVLTNEMVYIFSVDNQKVKLVRSKNAVAVNASIETLRKQVKLDFANHGHSDYLEFVTASHRLYNSLIRPMEAVITGKRLLIIPDGLLGYIPFELLIEELPEKSDKIEYYKLTYLMRKSPISYAYSATLRFDGKQSVRKKGRRLIAFVPDYSHSELLPISQEVRNGLDLTPLPYALEEAKNVKASMGGNILHAEKANKVNFLKNAGDYDILHLAMHAQINDQDPLYSRLIFQPLSDSIDAFTLNTYELYSLQLNAQMVVLSACNTGAGKLQQGEGVMSLTRGFVYAGVPSIVMTAWEVHDESGALMMDHFYKLLSDGTPKDVALQQAKLAFLDQASQLKAHPYFWSAYILIGDAEPLAPPKRSFWWVVCSLVLLASLMLFFYGRQRSKRLKGNG
jgi:CHAT domain-containing protein